MNLFLRISICLTGLILIGASILFIFNDPLELSYEIHPVSYLTEKIRLNPYDTYAYYLRGRFYLGNNELDKAITDYTMAINLKDRHYISIYEPRGYAYFKKKEWAKALDDFNKFSEHIKNEKSDYLLDDIHQKINICKEELEKLAEQEKQGGRK